MSESELKLNEFSTSLKEGAAPAASAATSVKGADAQGATPWAGLILAAAGSIAFSGKAIIVKLAYRYQVDAVTVIMYRMLFALPLFLLLAWWAGRGKPALSLRDKLMVLWLGFTGYYLASMLDFMGLSYITASLERLILYLGPTIVLLINVMWFKRRVTGRQWAAAALSYVGTLVVFGHEMNLQGQHTAWGSLLVFGSAVSYALYLIGSGEVVGRLGSMRLTGLASSVACGFCLLQFALLRPLSAAVVPEPVIWLSLLNSTACTVAPVLMVMMAIERIGASLSAQVGMIGPLSTITLGIFLLGEPFTPLLLVGTALVLAGIWLLARWR